MRGELRVSDAAKAAAAFCDAITNLEAIERELSAAEEWVWQPHWSKHDPLAEHLRRVGVTTATVESVICLVRGWDAIRRAKRFTLIRLHCSISMNNRKLPPMSSSPPF